MLTTITNVPPRAVRTKCPGCGGPVDHQHEIGRAGRRQTYCSTKCRRQDHRSRDFVRRHDFPACQDAHTGPGTQSGHKLLKSRPDKERDCRSSLFDKAPLDLLGHGYRWPATIQLDSFTRVRIVRAEIGGSLVQAEGA